jgi:hypothetical protein
MALWDAQGRPLTAALSSPGAVWYPGRKQRRPAKEAPGREWVINGQLLAGGASAIKRTQMQVIFASRAGRTAGKKKPGRRRPGWSDRTRYGTIDLTDRQWTQEKARPRGAAAGRRSRCCPPVVGRRTVEIMHPIR